MTEPLLEVRSLSKSFGGLVATDDVSLTLDHGEIHAVIGPNGAGKTTLIHQLSGQLRSDHGRILIGGRDVTGTPPAGRARMGLARSFQITSLFADFTALDNVAMAVQPSQGHSFRFWRPARRDPSLRDEGMAVLARLDLDGRANVKAGNLSHGEQRQLELAMVLAMRPRALLLDEPMAGMSHDESGRIIGLLKDLKRDYGILLIEHDMNAVFALAERITVLVDGRVLATGPAEEIRGNPEVRRAYLGETKSTSGKAGSARRRMRQSA